MGIRERQKIIMNNAAMGITKWIGSPESLILHTLFFIGSFLLSHYGIIEQQKMLLLLTTAVSLEAIYMSIFIQMTLNLSNQQIEYIQEDLEEIQKDVEEIQEDVDEISEDVEEIQEISTEKNIQTQEAIVLMSIQATLTQLQKEVEQLKSNLGK